MLEACDFWALAYEDVQVVGEYEGEDVEAAEQGEDMGENEDEGEDIRGVEGVGVNEPCVLVLMLALLLGSQSTRTGLPKKRAICTSVESSSPGMISSLGDFTFWTRLWMVRRNFCFCFWGRG